MDEHKEKDERKPLLNIWLAWLASWLNTSVDRKWPRWRENPFVRVITVIGGLLYLLFRDNYIVGYPFRKFNGIVWALPRFICWALLQIINRPIVAVVLLVFVVSNWQWATYQLGFNRPPASPPPSAAQVTTWQVAQLQREAREEDKDDEWSENLKHKGSHLDGLLMSSAAQFVAELMSVEAHTTLLSKSHWMRLATPGADIAHHEPWVVSSLAATYERETCERAGLKRPHWTPNGLLLKFQCSDERGRLYDVAPPDCNRRDVLALWSNTAFRAACMKGREKDQVQLWNQLAGEGLAGLARLETDETSTADAQPLELESSWLNVEAYAALELALTEFNNEHGEECGLPRITDANRTVEWQLELFVRNCVMSWWSTTGAANPPNMICNTDEVQTCRPFKFDFTLEDAGDALQSVDGTFAYLKKKAKLDPELCPHTSGRNVDMFVRGLTQASSMDEWLNSPCYCALFKVMSDRGFCALSKSLRPEPWHFEYRGFGQPSYGCVSALDSP